jgi:hypothetical protein
MEWTRGWSQNDGALGCSGISDFWSLHHVEKLSKMCLHMGLALVLIDFHKFSLNFHAYHGTITNFAGFHRFA